MRIEDTLECMPYGLGGGVLGLDYEDLLPGEDLQAGRLLTTGYIPELKRKVRKHAEEFPVYGTLSTDSKRFIRDLYLELANSREENELGNDECKKLDFRLQYLSLPKHVTNLKPVLNSSDGSKVNLESEILGYIQIGRINKNDKLYKILKYGTPTTSQPHIQHQS